MAVAINAVAVADVGGKMPYDSTIPTATANHEIHSVGQPAGTVVVGATNAPTIEFKVQVRSNGLPLAIDNIAQIKYPIVTAGVTSTATVASTLVRTPIPPADLSIVKRITAIAGISQVGTLADNTNPDFPTGYVQGKTTAGTVKPGDEIEYTIYYVNKGARGAQSVRICDLLDPNLTFNPDGFDPVGFAGHGIQLKLGTSTPQVLTSANDPTIDRAQYVNGTPPVALSGCNFPVNTANASGTVVVDITSASATDPSSPNNLLTIPAAIGSPIPNNSYGSFKFKAKVR